VAEVYLLVPETVMPCRDLQNAYRAGGKKRRKKEKRNRETRRISLIPKGFLHRVEKGKGGKGPSASLISYFWHERRSISAGWAGKEGRKAASFSFFMSRPPTRKTPGAVRLEEKKRKKGKREPRHGARPLLLIVHSLADSEKGIEASLRRTPRLSYGEEGKERRRTARNRSRKSCL